MKAQISFHLHRLSVKAHKGMCRALFLNKNNTEKIYNLGFFLCDLRFNAFRNVSGKNVLLIQPLLYLHTKIIAQLQKLSLPFM